MTKRTKHAFKIRNFKWLLTKRTFNTIANYMHILMHDVLSWLLGISPLNGFRNVENSLKKLIEKTLEKQEITHYVFCQHLETHTIFEPAFLRLVLNFVNSLFSTVLDRLLREFPIFLKLGFSAEIPINRDRIGGM